MVFGLLMFASGAEYCICGPSTSLLLATMFSVSVTSVFHECWLQSKSVFSGGEKEAREQENEYEKCGGCGVLQDAVMLKV